MLLGCPGSITAASCLVPDGDYCAFVYGDASCPAERSFCVLARHEQSHAGINDGCSADVPEGFIHARYGLPTMIAAPAEGPDDPRALEDVLRRFGYEDCGSPEELEASLGPAVARTAEVRRYLERQGRVRRAAMALSEHQVIAIAALVEGIDAWVRDCEAEGEPTETVGSSTSSESTGAESSSATGIVPCDCTTEAPFCDPATGECVTCDVTPEPNDSCRNLDVTAPLCFEGACVECTEGAPEACVGTTPICDEATHTCVPCTAHHECGEAACNFFTGTCLPADAVVHVGGPAPDFLTITGGVASIPEGTEATLVVHADYYDEVVTVGGDRVLAFLAAEPGTEPVQWRNISIPAPQLTVTAGATALLEGIALSDNAFATDPALLIDGGRAWVDRGMIVRNDGGGIVANASAELTLRNCFVGGNVADQDALAVNGATARIVYTTLGAGSGASTALVCSGASTVAVRNSLLVSSSSEAEVACPWAIIEDSVAELDLGVSNQGLGPMSTLWFVNYTNGDFHLTPSRPQNIAVTADWRSGDVRVDIDGDPRPTRDGSIDYAGADVP